MSTVRQTPVRSPGRRSRWSRIVSGFLVAAGVGVIVFGLALPRWVPYRREVLNWSTAWALFDVVLGAAILATWWAARRHRWWAFATAGAVNALQVTDVIFSLLLFYDVSERPGILVWAFVFQPGFAVAVWWYVLRNVARPAATAVDGAPEQER